MATNFALLHELNKIYNSDLPLGYYDGAVFLEDTVQCALFQPFSGSILYFARSARAKENKHYKEAAPCSLSLVVAFIFKETNKTKQSVLIEQAIEPNVGKPSPTLPFVQTKR